MRTKFEFCFEKKKYRNNADRIEDSPCAYNVNKSANSRFHYYSSVVAAANFFDVFVLCSNRFRYCNSEGVCNVNFVRVVFAVSRKN